MVSVRDKYFDPADPAIISDPYAAYRRLREEAPVYWHESLGSWLLTRYRDCSEVLHDSDVFAADFRRIGETTSPELLSVQTVDPPEHTRLRHFLTRGFREVDLAELERWAGARAALLLAELSTRDSFDFISDFSDVLALATITRLLGVEPPANDEAFTRLNDDLDRSMDAGFDPESEATGRAAREHFNRVVAGWIESKPEQGMLRWAIDHLAEAPGPLDMLVNSTRAFFHAGFEVPSRFLGNALLALLRAPKVYPQISDSGSVTKTALQELVRYAGPVQALSRACTQDIQLGGTLIRRGEIVVALIAAGNRDPEQFPSPESLLLSRDPNAHLSFGRGAHACLGFRVGLLEARAALTTLAAEYPDAQLVGAPQPRSNATLRGLRSLPVALGQRQRRAQPAMV